MKFDGFIGNENIKFQLSSYLERGQFPHAILLEGEEGLGKKTLGKIIAKALLCQCADSSKKPCDECDSCKKLDSGNHPDVRVEGGLTTSRSFHIDVIREIRASVYIRPNESSYRVFLFVNAQAMTVQAQNALLKIIEEPPKHAIFILTCESRSELLETIQSRTVLLQLERVEKEQAIDAIMRVAEVDREEAEKAGLVFGGNIGRAVSGLKEGDFSEIVDLIPRFGDAIVSKQDLDLLRLTSKFERNKPLTDGVIDGLFLLFRDALVLRQGGSFPLSVSPETADKISKKLTSRQILKLIVAIESLKKARFRNMNETLFITLFTSRLRTAVKIKNG